MQTVRDRVPDQRSSNISRKNQSNLKHEPLQVHFSLKYHNTLKIERVPALSGKQTRILETGKRRKQTTIRLLFLGNKPELLHRHFKNLRELKNKM